MWHWEVHLIPNPIRKVLSSMQTHRVRALLMGGQACVFYGAAEFSRDTDLAVLADDPTSCGSALLRASSIANGRAGAILVPRIANDRVAGGTRCTVSGRLCSRGATPSIVDRSQGGRCQ
jgi:hypothetical protein